MRYIGIGIIVLGAIILLISGLMGLESNAVLGSGGFVCVLGSVLHVVLSKQEDKKSA